LQSPKQDQVLLCAAAVPEGVLVVPKGLEEHHAHQHNSLKNSSLQVLQTSQQLADLLGDCFPQLSVLGDELGAGVGQYQSQVEVHLAQPKTKGDPAENFSSLLGTKLAVFVANVGGYEDDCEFAEVGWVSWRLHERRSRASTSNSRWK
jgi:hypothetical protein